MAGPTSEEALVTEGEEGVDCGVVIDGVIVEGYMRRRGAEVMEPVIGE